MKASAAEADTALSNPLRMGIFFIIRTSICKGHAAVRKHKTDAKQPSHGKW